jgi:tetratricopeptide (TPR) repeat protein
MSEDGIESLLGNDKGSSEGEIGVAAADAVAMVASMDAAKSNAEVAEGVRGYLEKQSRLVDLQLMHFDEERRLAIAAAKRKRLGDRLRIATQLMLALVIVAAMAALIAAFYDALTDRGVKIEAFAVPPHLADQGMTGQVVAKKILDRITELQRGSGTVRATNSFANNWGHDIKVEVPETGISIGEISHWIHDSVGRSTRVDGEVYYTNTGVAVSVRVGDYPTIEALGAEADLSKLIQDAATRVYAQTQPYRYGFWLASQGQMDESNAVYRQLYAEGNPADRIWALNGLANNEESTEKYIVAERRVLALNPHFVLGELNVAQADSGLGHPELALSEVRAAMAADRGIADETLSPSGRALVLNAGQEIQEVLACDYQAANLMAIEDVKNATSGHTRDLARMQQAVVLIALHDPLSATELLDLVQVPKYRRGEIRFSDLRIRVAAEGGDWAGALSELERSNAQYPRETLLGRRSRDPVFFAELYAHAGRYTEADEVLASNPSDNYEGWRARGRVATLRQDYSNAEQAFTQAVRLAPSFAPAYKDWGDLLRAKGDLTGAIAKYSDANRRGPHWADPSKSWGDVLLMQGKLHEALVKYDAALKYAPNWAALKAAREAAAKRSS